MKPVIFLHMPKAAGSTYIDVLARKQPSGSMVHLQGDSEERQAFINSPQEQRNQVSLLVGHMPYGMDAYLGAPASYITILRDPVDRIVSHYYFILRHENNYLHEIVAKGGMSLEEFVGSQVSVELDNLQTRILAPEYQAPFGGVGQKELQAALGHLRGCAVVGLQEEPDKTLVLIKRFMGWKTVPLMVKKNVTANRPAKDQIPGRVRDIILETNSLDVALHKEAQNLLATRFAKLGLPGHWEERWYSSLRHEMDGPTRRSPLKTYARAFLHFCQARQ